MPFAFKSFPEYIKSLKNRENLILIRISGGAYGDYWSRDLLCPKTIDLKKLEEKLRNEAWGYITPEETFEWMEEQGCIPITYEPNIDINIYRESSIEPLQITSRIQYD